ncbi:MAG: tetratricopeptide repeat-containing sensor histidine kinase [Bacteroidia bacterium]|nr:tetratricopeptide repeat-containing sensor histidine kinase [Bacteroidia bacterium]MBP9724388.1 tetratricopeptide repeat-containing sensor histidine kinase [Bacteroidia bacterium]
MPKRPLPFFALLCITLSVINCSAQANKLDSLLEAFQEVSTLKITEQADLYNDLFREYLENDFDSAMYFGKKAEELSIKAGYDKGLGDYYNQQGTYNKDLGNYYTALLWDYKYLEISEKRQEPKSIASAHNNIGIVYKLQENYALALDHLSRSLRIKKQENMEKETASTINNIGNVYFSRNQYDSALLYFFQALNINKKYNQQKFIFINLRNIAETYIKKGMQDSATRFIKEATEILNTNKFNKKQYTEWYILKATYYTAFNNSIQGKAYADSSLSIAVKIGLRNEMLDAYKLLAAIAESEGKTADAYQSLSRYTQLRDSLYKESISAQVSDIQQSYELKKLDADVERLRLEKILLATIFAFALLLVVILTVFLKKRYKTIQLLNLKNQQLSVLDEEKSNLMRLVAHDLKSPLSRINLLSQLLSHKDYKTEEEFLQYTNFITETSRESLEMINKFLSIDRSDWVDIQIHKEPIDVRDLITKKVNRFIPDAQTKNISIIPHIAVNDVVLNTDLQCMRQILSNLINNAIKFAPIGSSIVITVLDDDHHFIFEVKDNGPGIPAEQQKSLFNKYQLLTNKPTGNETSSGLGLYIVKRLVDRLGGEIWVKSEPGKGTSFFVSLPKG